MDFVTIGGRAPCGGIGIPGGGLNEAPGGGAPIGGRKDIGGIPGAGGIFEGGLIPIIGGIAPGGGRYETGGAAAAGAPIGGRIIPGPPTPLTGPARPIHLAC
jgi:hypothetical protein